MSSAMDNGNPAGEVMQFNTGDIAVLESPPRSDWSEMSGSEHFVQFYEQDAFLLDSLAGFVHKGLGAGEACIVVATEAHRDGLEELLRQRGVDVDTARSAGQYVSLDAAETLSQFMFEGLPQPERFVEVIGGLITRAAEGGRHVRIFGEMVALLWAEGKQTAALQLEDLWNKQSATHPFLLFCAYPMSGFAEAAHADSLAGVCTSHSRVIPDESYSSLADADERLRTIIQLQQKARSLEAEIAQRKKVEESLLTLKDELEVQVKDLRQLHVEHARLHRQLQQELEERQQSLTREQIARAEAEDANRLKDEFLATASHELRTPLTAILGWSHMVRHGRLDEATVARAMETIERNAQLQAQLIEDILDMSRVITGQLRLNIEPVDAAAVINAAIDSVQLAANAKEIQLEVTLDPSARRVAGDASRLQQVVWNLLSNAIKFTPSGGRVQVRLERAGPAAQIMVSDTGCGFSPEFRPFIFDRFRQADGTTTRRHGGLGLGLAIVRQLVELHGGTVEADSPGQDLGATFTIKLPLAVARENLKGRAREVESLRLFEESSLKPKSLPSLDGVRVLLVDDDQDTLNTLAAILTGYNATVQAVSSASEALDILRWYTPTVLVSDLAMPDEDGYALIGKIRAAESESVRRTPAVALTAYVRVEDRVRALTAGFNMFVPKPVEPNELVTAIANLAETCAG